MKARVQIACVEALWKLSKGCLLCCKKITETKGLLCLPKIIEMERGELPWANLCPRIILIIFRAFKDNY